MAVAIQSLTREYSRQLGKRVSNMTRINELFEAIGMVETQRATEIRELQKELEVCLRQVWDRDEKLAKELARLEDSNQYGSNENGIYRWIRASLPEIAEREREYFENWLAATTCAYIDWENDAIYTYEGDAIVINEDGDVFMEHKLIIRRKEYESDAERNKLIEAYMEKTGYFPGVFRMTQYGDIWPVNTQEKSA
jgi:hypothetical protein